MASKQTVQQLLEDIEGVDSQKHEILQALRTLVAENISALEQRVMYGGIMFSANGVDFGGVYVSQKHVSFEFGKGFAFQDPESHLEGSGKFRRHLKIQKLEDIETKNVIFFLKQAVA